MRVTINVVHREVLYFLKEKGYAIVNTYNNLIDTSKIFAKIGNGPITAIYITKKDHNYTYTICSIKNTSTIQSHQNYLAHLRLFMEGEL